MDDFIVVHEGAGQFLTGFAEGILLELRVAPVAPEPLVMLLMRCQV
jgi:hypothetical protein